jgi:hypothetical protein
MRPWTQAGPQWPTSAPGPASPARRWPPSSLNNVLFTDVHEAKKLAAAYRVQMIPTQIFFDAKGKEVKRHVGFMDKADILKELHAAGLK